MEQEIKELHTGLGAVVEALNFLQTFLESDYGLKYQFHAYCNSSLYSHNSGVLEVLKQKYPGNTQESCYTENDRLYQTAQHSSSSEADNNTLVQIRYSGQGVIQGIEQTNIDAIASVSSIDQNYVSNSNHSRHHTPSVISSVAEDLNSSQRSIIVNEDELFAISDHLGSLKEESNNEIFHPDEEDIDTFSRTALEDENDSNEEMINIESPSINEVTTNMPVTNRRGKAKKKVITEHYKCPHCRRRCPDRAKLELHMTHHKQQFQCSQCGIWLADKSVLNRHMRTHTGDRPFKCVFCKESFSRQDIVKKHIQRKHKEMIENSQSSVSNS